MKYAFNIFSKLSLNKEMCLVIIHFQIDQFSPLFSAKSIFASAFFLSLYYLSLSPFCASQSALKLQALPICVNVTVSNFLLKTLAALQQYISTLLLTLNSPVINLIAIILSPQHLSSRIPWQQASASIRIMAVISAWLFVLCPMNSDRAINDWLSMLSMWQPIADLPGLPALAPSKKPEYCLLRGTWAMVGLNLPDLNIRCYCRIQFTVFYLYYFQLYSMKLYGYKPAGCSARGLVLGFKERLVLRVANGSAISWFWLSSIFSFKKTEASCSS